LQDSYQKWIQKRSFLFDRMKKNEYSVRVFYTLTPQKYVFTKTEAKTQEKDSIFCVYEFSYFVLLHLPILDYYGCLRGNGHRKLCHFCPFVSLVTDIWKMILWSGLSCLSRARSALSAWEKNVSSHQAQYHQIYTLGSLAHHNCFSLCTRGWHQSGWFSLSNYVWKLNLRLAEWSALSRHCVEYCNSELDDWKKRFLPHSVLDGSIYGSGK